MIYFIAGASGSGKSAIIPNLKNLLKEKLNIYDFDDIEVPEGADKKWRQESTEKWLQKLLSNNKDTCLLGQVVLGEILSCQSYDKTNKINFCFLDVSDVERIKRLKKSNIDLANQEMLHWASWLRMHISDPCWYPEVIKQNSWEHLNWNCFDNLQIWEQKAQINVIDTTHLSVLETATKVAYWITEINNQ